MPGYSLFAAVRVMHDYFADGHARHMVFSPRVETAAFLRRFDLLVHSDGQNLAISISNAQWAGIWSERMDDAGPRALCFDVRSTDPACAYYTDGTAAPSPAAVDVIHEVPLRPVDNHAGAPLATMELPLNATATDDYAAWTEALGTSYQLRMSTRSTIWKYLLVGDWRDRKLAIADQRGEVAFSPFSSERMSDGRHALVTRSTSSITLRERPVQRFQLMDVTDSPERVLIPRLPGAKPQALWRETQGSTSIAVSEIFVHC
ncbi:MAG: hypothetical protein ACTS5I_00955 [Rhodanobacter sp.]